MSAARRLAPSLLSVLCAAAFAPLAAADEAVSVLPDVKVTGARIAPGSLRDSAPTATKTDTPLRDVPATVVVLPKEVLRQQAVTDMNKALENVSGVQPVMGGGYGFANNYFIRGMAMRFLRDGLPDGTSMNGYYRTIWDIDRIEVLKGPGSALYGMGQPGGTVNVVTRAPQAKRAAEIGAMVGSYKTRAGYVDATGALSERVNARVIVDRETSDGFRGLSRDITEISPSFTFRLSEANLLTLDYDHRDIEVKPDNYGIIFDTDGRLVDVPVEAKYYTPFNETKQKIDRLTLKHEWTFSDALSLRTVFLKERRELHLLRNAGGNGGNKSGQMTGRNLREQDDDVRYMTFQNELIWNVGLGSTKHTVLLGMEYNEQDAKTVRVGYNLPDIGDIRAPQAPELSKNGMAAVAAQGFNRTLDLNSLGFYIQDQIELTKQIKLRAGLRTDRVDYRDSGASGLTSYREIGDSTSLDSGNIGAVWQPNETLSFYSGYSTSKFVNLATEAANISKNPESAKQFESGVKTSVLDGKLDLNLAYFHSRRQNFYVNLVPGVSTADGHERIRGFDLDAQARPVAGATVLFNFTVQDPEVLSNAVASNASVRNQVTNRSVRGTMPAGVAKRSARVWTNYAFQSAALNGWSVGLGATYKAESYADALNLYQVPSYTVWDAAIAYKSKQWETTLALRNLTDKRYFTTPTFSGALPGEDRNAMLTMRVRF